MEDFASGTTHDQPARRQSSLGPEWDARVHQLVTDWGAEKSPELLEEMIITVLKMARDRMGTADLKLMTRSLKEMRYAAKVFAGYREFRKVCVFGSARTSPTAPEYAVAEEFAREMVAQKYMVITGGGDGIMGAANRGAGRANSFGLNIRLPFEQKANETIEGDPKLINFNYFFTRKLNFVKETHALALFPGGFGTMDEGFEVLTLMQTGKARIIPVVMVDAPNGTYWEEWLAFLTNHLYKFGFVSPEDFRLFKIVHTASDAVAEILHFYKEYHSARWVGEQLVIRILRPLTKPAVADLNAKFRDIIRSGEIVQGTALRQEKNEPALWDLPRLIVTPYRRSFARLRELIDAINAAELAPVQAEA
ncbi:MAG TPA: TIGR00730 family Rossman fold protein [Chthoniobacterales bacterium]